MSKPTIIYGTNGGKTPTTVVEKVGPTSTLLIHPIAEFADPSGRDAAPGEIYYSDNKVSDGGDGTVPLISAKGQFKGEFIDDSRVILRAFTMGENTAGKVGHTELPYNVEVQQLIFETLGVPFDPREMSAGGDISTDLAGYGFVVIGCAAGCSNLGLYPVAGFLVDAQGRRLGFSAATGPVTEIPDSIWFGNSDEMGWVFGPVVEPLTLALTGLGESYYVTASVFSKTGSIGLVDKGVLGLGEQRVLTIPTAAPTPGVSGLGLVIMAGLLLAASFWAIRRRRKILPFTLAFRPPGCPTILPLPNHCSIPYSHIPTTYPTRQKLRNSVLFLRKTSLGQIYPSLNNKT
ncbi:MAG: hypothetical protein EXR53_00435 [Dehalococcoidia bacterium]|nr:hypothetical protein [Dehalococcoidia bacterium]